MDKIDDHGQASMIGRTIGVYRLEEEIGRGGMGAVYRAVRTDGEFDQTVAIKLIKRGMDTDQILNRFRRERQILAALNHPNIASFLRRLDPGWLALLRNGVHQRQAALSVL